MFGTLKGESCCETVNAFKNLEEASQQFYWQIKHITTYISTKRYVGERKTKYYP